MKLQVTIFLFCLIMATAAAYTVLTGCGCHFGGCICADDGPVTLGIPGRNGRAFNLREALRHGCQMVIDKF